MKVYIVYHNSYDADYDESYVRFRVFSSKAAADAYRESRKTKDGLFWDDMAIQEVE